MSVKTNDTQIIFTSFSFLPLSFETICLELNNDDEMKNLYNLSIHFKDRLIADQGKHNTVGKISDLLSLQRCDFFKDNIKLKK